MNFEYSLVFIYVYGVNYMNCEKISIAPAICYTAMPFLGSAIMLCYPRLATLYLVSIVLLLLNKIVF